MAVSILMEKLEEGRTRPRRAVLSPSLVVRGTTAPPTERSGG
jgi:DNA-binding LacI/PurR family transcriptional regulator